MKHLLAVLSLIAGYPPASTEIWQSPIQGSYVVNQYLAPASEYSAGHRGIDLATEINQIVFAPVAGVISFAGKVGYREVLTLDSGLQTLTFEPVCSDLSVGMSVGAGEAIGRICQPDQEYLWHCEIICLHLGLKTTRGYLSAERFIFGMAATRLLP